MDLIHPVDPSGKLAARVPMFLWGFKSCQELVGSGLVSGLGESGLGTSALGRGAGRLRLVVMKHRRPW